MTPPAWVLELAREFPTSARFPRDLRTELMFGPANIAVVALPRLTTTGVRDHLSRCELTVDMPEKEQPLRGCVFAWRGEALLFVSEDDPEDEQRFTLAHELAHVLRHYRQPRERCVALMGKGILAVLDGDRPPDLAEAIHAALRGVPLGPHVCLFGRIGMTAEAEADRLACELLAPADAVRRRTNPNDGRPDVERELILTFGLPPSVARDYAREFAPPDGGPGGWLANLRNIASNLSNS